MDIKQLRYFIITAEQGSIQNAAPLCFTSQQNLSRAIAKLEEELEITLFQRSKNGVVLTPEGKEILANAKITVANALALKERADILSSKHYQRTTDEITIFAADAFANYCYALQQVFIEKFPNIKLNIKLLEPAHLRHIVETKYNQDYFYMLLIENPQLLIEQYPNAILLEEDRLVLTCGNNSPLKQYKVLSKNALATIPIFFEQTDSTIQPLMHSIMEKNHVFFEKIIYYSHLYFCTQALSESRYATIAFATTTKNSIYSPTFFHKIELEEPIMLTPIILPPKNDKIHGYHLLLSLINAFPKSL